MPPQAVRARGADDALTRHPVRHGRAPHSLETGRIQAARAVVHHPARPAGRAHRPGHPRRANAGTHAGGAPHRGRPATLVAGPAHLRAHGTPRSRADQPPDTPRPRGGVRLPSRRLPLLSWSYFVFFVQAEFHTQGKSLINTKITWRVQSQYCILYFSMKIALWAAAKSAPATDGLDRRRPSHHRHLRTARRRGHARPRSR